MKDIDLQSFALNPDQLFLLNICLGFLMFAVSIDIRLADFKRVFYTPKAALVGLTSQLLLLPLLGVVLVYLFQPAASIALGMMMIAACPGGNVSNYAVHLAKGNTALSILMTSFTTVCAILITPISFGLWTKLIPNANAISISVEPSQMIQTIFLLIFIPLLIGMSCHHFLPKFTQKINKPVKTLAMVIFISFAVVAIYSKFDELKTYVHLVFVIVLVYNALAFLIGYWFARINKLGEYTARAVSIETGIQNTGLGLILIFNFFDGLGGMALIVAWWGIWHLVSGFLLANYWGKRPILPN
jgi:BASS family bile acid:Na+ symporter